ncbi:hypothetical protein AB0F17_62460, partial [Nonomuraea sp. NPDC026600]|uniref:hypothetical protein n=1 Tax=Nonomuraea sp. NPDC026600 TaxID=3155363 RepID=UPI003403EBE3
KITTLQTQRTRRSTLHVYLYLALHWNPYADKWVTQALVLPVLPSSFTDRRSSCTGSELR